ncbi:hypothetical protein, partial [Ruminococcus sp.]|uniref:hypothetical protein n=1 Tax=Ruminococcus sp. TaxID=41978 RepID=UPI003990DA12
QLKATTLSNLTFGGHHNMQGTFFVKIFNKLWFNSQFSQSIIKVCSTFLKVVGVGKAHKYFPFTQSNNSQTARCLAA